MKFKLLLKDPDGIGNSLRETAEASVNLSLGDNVGNLSDDEYNELVESRESELKEFISNWVEYEEYVELEFDTDKNTCEVK